MKSNIPKLIFGMFVITAIVVIAWLSLPAFWFWVFFEIIAALFVAIGCSGEWWLHHHPAGRKRKEKDKHHKLESRFIAMVALGVIMEVFALTHSIREGVRLENKLADAVSTATTNELRVAALTNETVRLALELEKTKLQLTDANIKLAEIKNAIPPRTIPEKQRELFIATMLQTNAGSPKIDIKVFVQNRPDQEANDFANSIRKMLNEAGYGTNGEKVIKIPPFAISPRDKSQNVRLPHIFSIYATDKDGKVIPLSMPSMGGNMMPFFPTKNSVEKECHSFAALRLDLFDDQTHG